MVSARCPAAGLCGRRVRSCRPAPLLSTTVRLVDVAHVQNAGYQHLAHHLPLVQGGRALHGNANAIQHGPVLLLTAGDERTFFSAMSLPPTTRGKTVDDPLDLGGMEYQYTGMVNLQGVCFQAAGAMRLKSSSKEQAFPVLKQVLQAWQPPGYFIMAASKRVTVWPLAWAARMNASVMAKLLPSLRGLPVITTIFFAHGGSSSWPGIDFSHAFTLSFYQAREKDKYAHESVILT